MIPSLKKALETIGLNKNEVAVLLVLLARGPLLVSIIAKAARLNRSTAYGVLKLLAGKGLASSAKERGVVRYQSIAPELLPGYIERKGEELLETKNEVAAIVPQLKLLKSKGSVLPKVQFFEGVEGIKQAYEDKLEHNKEKALYEFTGMEAGYKKLDRAWIDYYTKKRAGLGIRAEYVSPDTPFTRETAKMDEMLFRKVHFIPPEYDMETEISIYDDKVSMASFSAENPVAVLIEDEAIARTMKKIFERVAATAK